MKKKSRLQMLAALLAATLSMALTSPIAAKANEEYNVDTTKESNAETGRIYYLKNSHGDVIGQMDENGNVLTSYAYNAFGEQVSAVAIQGGQKSTANRFLYAGEQYDETSGLYYLRARHYDSKAGRFTQEDTYLGDGRNLYAYVHSNPLKYVDPTGHYNQENFDPDGNSWDEKLKNEGGGNINNVPQQAYTMAQKISANGGVQVSGYKGGGTYRNVPTVSGGQQLPTGVSYKEYDIHPYVQGQNRGAERLVMGSDNSVWYTSDHYTTFTQIK